MQATLPGIEENWPTEQPMQSDASSLPGPLTKVPAGQSMQSEAWVLPVPGTYLPADALPFLKIFVGPTLFGDHGFEGAPRVFVSSSRRRPASRSAQKPGGTAAPSPRIRVGPESADPSVRREQGV